MANPKAFQRSPLVQIPPGPVVAGTTLAPCFYEKDTTTGLPTGLVYDEAGNLIPAPNFPSGTGVVKVTSGVQALATPNVDFKLPGTARTLTASGNAVLADDYSILTGNHATVAIVVTIPPASSVAWVAGAQIRLFMKGAAACSFLAGAGVTLHDPGSLTAALVQYGILKAQRVAADEWTIVP